MEYLIIGLSDDLRDAIKQIREGNEDGGAASGDGLAALTIEDAVLGAETRGLKGLGGVYVIPEREVANGLAEVERVYESDDVWAGMLNGELDLIAALREAELVSEGN